MPINDNYRAIMRFANVPECVATRSWPTRAFDYRAEALLTSVGRKRATIRNVSQTISSTSLPQLLPPAKKQTVPIDTPTRTMRTPAKPLPEGFPRIQAYSVTYPKNLESMKQTEASFEASDWNDELKIFVQPAEWPISANSASLNAKRMLEAAVADGCDFALFLEDDVRVGKHLRHNLISIPLVRRDQCDFLSLYIPDLIASPWERREPHLGYRKAWPRYTGPQSRLGAGTDCGALKGYSFPDDS